MKKFFNIDLHCSVIRDVENIFEQLYVKQIMIDSHSISGHSLHLLGKMPSTKYILQNQNWKLISTDFIKQFYIKHKTELDRYDGFIVTHTPSFALFFEKFGKPIIIVNSTRYEQPASHNSSLDQWKFIDESLKRLNSKGLLTVISNNLYDQLYIKTSLGIDSTLIPSLCEYTNSKRLKLLDQYKLFCIYSSQKNPINKIEGIKLLNINQIKPYTYETLCKFTGIIHIPYEISTMSIFEHYTMNIPLIFPTKEFLLKMFNSNELNVYGSYSALFNFNSNPKALDILLKDNWFEKMLPKADYYNEEYFPYITYFDSLEDLELKLNTINFDEISDKMKEFNKKRKDKILNLWKQTLKF